MDLSVKIALVHIAITYIITKIAPFRNDYSFFSVFVFSMVSKTHTVNMCYFFIFGIGSIFNYRCICIIISMDHDAGG